jgi:hypothetical protein
MLLHKPWRSASETTTLSGDAREVGKDVEKGRNFSKERQTILF